MIRPTAIAAIVASLTVASAAHGQAVMQPPPTDVAGVQAQAASAASTAAQAKASADAAQAALSSYATTSALAAVQATIPTARTVVPLPDAVGGVAGTAGSYLPGNAQPPRITRAGIVTTGSNGAWSVGWTMSLPATPVTLPIPINATAEPVVCNVATSTAAGATGRCWYARTLPATLVSLSALLNFDLFGAPANGIQVQVLAIPATQ